MLLSKLKIILIKRLFIWIKLNCTFESAAREWIPFIAILTEANGTMVDNLALSVETACTQAWIHTLFSNARLVIRTILVDNAFRSAIWWTSYVSSETLKLIYR